MIREIPLEMKLLGANLLIVGTVLLLMFGSVRLLPARLTDVYVVIAALIVSSAVNFRLGRLALTRRAISIGEMLDGLAAGRVRMEEVRAEVVYARGGKRFEVVQELNDSVGQRLAGSSFQIAGAANELEGRAPRILVPIGTAS